MADSFDDVLARLHGAPDATTYRAANEAAIARLDEVQEPFAIHNEEDYARAHAVLRMLSHLSCFTFNNQHPEEDRVWKLESVWAKVLKQYNRRLLIKDEDTRLVARYLLWRRYFLGVDARAAFVLARQKGILYRSGEGRHSVGLYIVGLDRAVGDNVFTVDRRGREHRKYGRTIGRQALEVLQPLPWSGDEAAAFVASLPELNGTYRPTSIGDYKHAARASAFAWKAKETLHALLKAVPEQELVPAPTMVSPPAAAVSEPAQLDLLAA